MPKGPRGESRHADVIGAAVMVGRIAVGDIEEERHEHSGKVRSGLAGAEARAQRTRGEERVAIARKAAAVRWA